MVNTLTYPMLLQAAHAILDTVDSYCSKGAPRSERTLDPVLFGFLLGANTKVDRQVSITVAGVHRRVDFRCRGNNPANLEWVVRPTEGGGQLSARKNTDEIKKLSRSVNARRYLLLLDLTPSGSELSKESLESDYRTITLGPGKYPRHSVTVVYVHRQSEFKFMWRP
jgi:hypothetical protein